MMHQPIADQVLVVGYGNSLRGDDGAGAFVANMLLRHGWPNIHILSTTQLVPELAEDIALSRGVIFVDAFEAHDQPDVRIQEITAAESATGSSHIVSPNGLLQLAGSCFGHVPRAWLVMVGGYEFGLTNRLTAAAEANAVAAARVVIELAQQLLSSEVQHA